MPAPTPKQNYDKDIWVPRFAQRLRALQTSMSGTEAMDIADSEYTLSCDLLPEEAAQIFVDEAPPGELNRGD